MGRHDDNLKRRAPFREPKHRILVVCEGEGTEPAYIRSFQHAMRNRLVHVEINDESGVPLTLVRRAIRLWSEAAEEAKRQRDDNLRFDEVWCVFDVDEHPHLSQAKELAKAEDIQLAISNPCIELWAILHFHEQSEALDRHAAQREARRLLPGYEKILPFEKLLPRYPEAVLRAQEIDRLASCCNVPGRNPTTGVYRLTEQIKRFGQR